MTNHVDPPSDRVRLPAVDHRDLSRPRASIQYCDNLEIIPIEIRDLSDSGAGFVVSQAPRLKPMVVLAMYHRGRIERIHAAITWSRPEGNNRWRAGCRFEGRMRTGSIATANATQRQAANTEFQVRCELDSEIRATARVVNDSNGGLCVWSPAAFPPGTKLLFEAKDVDPPLRFVAMVQWTRNDKGCFRMGCNFVGCCDMEAFRRCLPEFAGHSAPGGCELNPEPEPVLPGVWAGVRAGLRLVGSVFSPEAPMNFTEQDH